MVNHIWQSIDAILEDISDWNNCLMLNYEFKDYRLSVFQKLQYSVC